MDTGLCLGRIQGIVDEQDRAYLRMDARCCLQGVQGATYEGYRAMSRKQKKETGTMITMVPCQNDRRGKGAKQS
jgi:hypothetical protein